MIGYGKGERQPLWMTAKGDLARHKYVADGDGFRRLCDGEVRSLVTKALKLPFCQECWPLTKADGRIVDVARKQPKSST